MWPCGAQLDTARLPPRPSGERAGARGFELESASSPRPSPPFGEEREENGAVASCARPCVPIIHFIDVFGKEIKDDMKAVLT